MKRNLSRLISTVLALVMLFTVASASAEASAILGSKIQYDTSKAINNGEDIEIEFWYWTGASDLFKSVVNQYTAIHPNVKITLVENPYDDYWTKLPLALQGSNGPAIFNVHNSYHENLINYLAPYDIPVEDLEEDFVGVSAHVIDGKVYYTDYGMMTATMYYNKAMWSAAGLTEADIPATWDQFREVAKKLTIRDEKGDLIQAGFSFNGGAQGDVLGMQYQYGQNLFTEDGKVTFNNDAIKTVVQRIANARKRRVAAYARVSTNSDEQKTSYEAQVSYYTDYIREKSDWEFVRVYAEMLTPSLIQTHPTCTQIAP